MNNDCQHLCVAIYTHVYSVFLRNAVSPRRGSNKCGSNADICASEYSFMLTLALAACNQATYLLIIAETHVTVNDFNRRLLQMQHQLQRFIEHSDRNCTGVLKKPTEFNAQ